MVLDPLRRTADLPRTSPTDSDELVDRFRKGAGDKSAKKSRDHDRGKKKNRDSGHVPSRAKEKMKQREDHEHVREINLVAILAEQQKRT